MTTESVRITSVYNGNFSLQEKEYGRKIVSSLQQKLQKKVEEILCRFKGQIDSLDITLEAEGEKFFAVKQSGQKIFLGSDSRLANEFTTLVHKIDSYAEKANFGARTTPTKRYTKFSALDKAVAPKQSPPSYLPEWDTSLFLATTVADLVGTAGLCTDKGFIALFDVLSILLTAHSLQGAKEAQQNAEKIEDQATVKDKTLTSLHLAGWLAFMFTSFTKNFVFTTDPTLLEIAKGLPWLAAILDTGALYINGKGFIRCMNLKNQLTQFTENPHLTKEERVVGALNQLVSLFSLTEQEKEAIYNKVKKAHPDLSSEELDKLVVTKEDARIAAKMASVVKKSSSLAAVQVIKNAQVLIDKIKSGDKQALDKGQELIDSVFSEIKEQRSRYLAKIVTSCIGLTLFILTIILPQFFPSIGVSALTVYQLHIVKYSLVIGLILYYDIIKSRRDKEHIMNVTSPVDAPY